MNRNEKKKNTLLKCYRIEAKISRLVEYESSKHFSLKPKAFWGLLEACSSFGEFIDNSH